MRNINNSNMNQGQQNNNFNPSNIQQNINNFNNNNNNSMPNQNMQNNNNMNIQFLNFGFLKNDGSSSLNTIQNICAQKLNGDNAQKEISSSLKNTFKGEWVVLVVNSNDNFEFKISDFAPENVAVLKFENKIIYICKYV
jgi:hypothetical protein